MSTHALEKQGVFFNTRTCWMEFSNGSRAFEVKKHGAFRVVETPSSRICKNAHASSKAPKTSTALMDIWHARLGHIRKEAIQHITEAVYGAKLSSNDFERNSDLCQICELSQPHQQISRILTWRGSYPFEKVHMDLIDMEKAFNADSWVVHFYCDYSAYHISYNVTNKTQKELVSVTKEFLAITNDNWGFVTRYIQSDGEKGLGNEWQELVTARGITFRPSPADTPEQNGLAERSGGVIITTARKLRIQSKFPHKLWPHIVSHAIRLLNRIPVQRKDWKTPFEMVHGRKPDLSHIRIIGARAYVMVKNLRDRPSRAKLQEKAIMGWLIGTEAVNIYKVWIPQSNRVITSRDVRIDEKILYDPRQSMDLPRDNQALLAMLNEIDMDESGDDIIPNGNDITELAQSEAEAQHEQTSSRSQEVTSFQKPSNPSKFGYRQAHYPTPISMESGQLQTHMVQESRKTRSRTNKDTTALQNRHTISEGSTRLSKRGQENVNTSQAHATKRYTEKKARRQAHALQLERAKLGQQVAHAFAVAQSMRTHREDLLPPPEFWHQLKRHPERNGFRHAAEAELKSLKEKGTF